jgi:hypothetical protein
MSAQSTRDGIRFGHKRHTFMSTSLKANPLGLLARRTYDRIRDNWMALRYIAQHPGEIVRHRQWLWQRTGATVALRTPWWPYDAVDWVGARLPNGARVFEYGGGGSTLWLEDLGCKVTVAEHDENWYRQLSSQFVPDAKILFRPPGTSGIITSEAASGFFDAYTAAIDDELDNSFDLVIVDGRARVECVRRAMPKVKYGGLLILDDTDRLRYQPAVKLLGEWQRHIFTGLKPGQRFPAQTSVWRRPSG